MRILVVDDCVDTAKMMAVLLKAEGHKVKTTLDGPDALAMAREFLPEVVLLDLTLPSMSGVTVAEELRRIEGTENTRIVALSGYGAENLSRAFDAHFQKPVDHDALNTYLSRVANELSRGDGGSQPNGTLLLQSHPTV